MFSPTKISINSDWPLPATPAIPKISPTLTSKEIFFKSVKNGSLKEQEIFLEEKLISFFI